MNVKTYIVRSAHLIVIVSLLLGSIDSSAAQEMGKVQVTSLNLKGEIVPFIGVIIEGNGITRKLWPTGVGDEYENSGLVELPAGIYRVTSQNGNYFDFRRATFRIRPGVVTTINVYPLLSVRAQILMSDGSDRYELAPKPTYDVYTVPDAPDNALGMLVRYDKKRKSGEYVDYEGRALADREVMVSYDALSIYANKVRFHPRKFTLTASGDVIVEDGTQRIKANKVTIRFDNGAPEITTN